MKENVRLILFPFVLCLLLVLLQSLINRELDKPIHRCGCTCIDRNGNGQCERVCGIEYSDPDQARSCPVPSPPEWPPLLQIPSPKYLAVRTGSLASTDFPNESCRRTGSCPAAIIFTGNNRSLGEGWASKLFSSSSTLNSSDVLYNMARNTLGSDSTTETSNFLDPSFTRPLYHLQPQCSLNSTTLVSLQIASTQIQTELKCIQGLHLWRNSSSEINDEQYKGHLKGNPESKINEMVAAYDFSDSNLNKFNMSIWYNSSHNNDVGHNPLPLTRVPRSVNLASNAYLQLLLGSATNMLLEFVKEMPKSETKLKIDLASLLGPLFFTWVILQLFPVILASPVYEKQQKLRIMMKMHGLGDSPYWMISYAYFLVISMIYMFCFVMFGSLIGLKFFTLNDYTIQFVFYFIYINLQISMAFLLASSFSNVKTATGSLSSLFMLFIHRIHSLFGSGLLGAFLFQFFIEDKTFPRGWIIVMELYPGFSLFRGLYEFSQYAFTGNFMGTDGMHWENLKESSNGMREVLIIMSVEWLVILFVAYYVDQVVSSGSSRSPLFFLKKFGKKPLSSPSLRKPSLGRQGSKVFVQMDRPDVIQETEKVEQLLLESTASHAIIADNLKKVYPRRDGNPEKFAVKGLSLAVPQGECFGMLGPNGAGKTSFINMMIGLMKPSSGTAYVQGLDIRTQMAEIYTSMGVCPQHDLLWETLTGREHLLFYGRLKNLQGSALTQAVEESLKSVNLFHGGVADRRAGKYSGGMKRRLSVAISLIGDPKVVYMDEPSTGLDPASRNNLWNVVKRAKQNRAIILTTHSMEEAEHLCDRLGIFVGGSLQCIGNPKEFKGRYGGSYVFTMTTSPNHEEEVETLVRNLSQEANKIYHLSGTQKFELPKHEVRISDVFQAVENAKRSFTVHAWGLANTTLEDVFIKVARGAQAFTTLS